MPLPDASQSSVSQSTTSSRTTVTASSAYSAPSSLPDAFGVGPLFMWNRSSSRRADSEGSSTIGSRSTLGGTRTSATGLSVVSSLLRNPPPSSVTTSSWIMNKLEALSAARSSITPSQSASNVPPKHKVSSRARSETPVHVIESSDDETQLKDGDYDVDAGSVPESSDDEKIQKKNKKSIYIDDEAEGPKRKYSEPKARSKRPSPRKSTATVYDEEPPTKCRKRVRKEAKGKHISSDESSDEQVKVPKGLPKWNGSTQGSLNFLPKPHNFDKDSSPLWTYSHDGIARQSPSHRAVGDIHFSPNLGAGYAFHYWVQVGTVDGGCWELYNPGRQHPLYAGYVLTARKGKCAPGWTFKE